MDSYILLHDAFDLPFYFDKENKLSSEQLANDLDASNIEIVSEVFESLQKGTDLLKDQET